jgi:hypothetical protein
MERPEHDGSARERRVREPTPGDLVYTGLIILILGAIAIAFKDEATKSGLFSADIAGAVGAVLVVVGVVVVGAGIVSAVEQRSRARARMPRGQSRGLGGSIKGGLSILFRRVTFRSPPPPRSASSSAATRLTALLDAVAADDGTGDADPG